MVTIAIAALMMAGAGQQAKPCVPVPASANLANYEAQGDAWYINGEQLKINDRVYEKYGLPRTLETGDLIQLASYKGAMVYAQTTDPQNQVLYVLVRLAGCEFQPYAVM